MNNEKKMEGGCLCGSIRYVVSGNPYWTEYCHCRMCQKSAGAFAVSFFDIHPNQLTWLKDPPTEYQSSEDVRRGFCSTCGSTLSYRNVKTPELIGLTTATLDDPNSVTPMVHIFTDSQPEWLKMDDDCKRFPSWPDEAWFKEVFQKTES